MENEEVKNKIVDYIFKETKNNDKVKKMNINDGDLRDTVALFLDFLKYPVECDDIDGLSTRLYPVLQELALGESGRITVKKEFATLNSTEKYAKKILCVIDRASFNEIQNKHYGYYEVLKALGFETEDFKYVKTKLRNRETHNSPDLADHELYQELASYLAEYVILTYMYKASISRKMVNDQYQQDEETIKPIIERYKKKVIEDYEKKGGQDTFTILNLRRYLNNREMFDANVNSFLSEEGLYNEFRSDMDLVRIVGSAGSGKSRLLEHICYLDAKNNNAISVIIELRDWNYPSDSMLSLVGKKLNCNPEEVKKIILNKSVSICLDGVNEILCPGKEKKQILNAIENFHDEYSKVKLLITDRDNSSLTLFKEEPTYIMQEISYEIACDFVKKNCATKIEYIISQLENLFSDEDKESISMIASPYMLLTIIQLVENDFLSGDISADRIIPAYLISIIQREIDDKGDVDAKKIPDLLGTLVANCVKVKLEDSEEGYYLRSDVIGAFSECIKEKSYNSIDSMNILDDVIVPMGLLKNFKINDKCYYYFEHKNFENYFFRYAIDNAF